MHQNNNNKRIIVIMKRIFFLLLIICTLISCENNDIIVLDFTYTQVSPTMVTFTNKSQGFDSYTWDFGDGTFAYGYDAVHGYQTIGTYNTTLTGIIDGIEYDKTVTITISTPNIYFVGYTLYNIPYEGRYYKVSFKDDNLLPSSWDFKTTYTKMLYNSSLPYTAYFTPHILKNPDEHEYYTIQVIRSTNTTNDDNDVQCMKQKLKVKDIFNTYSNEYFLSTESGNTKIGILVEYSY